MDGQEIYEDMQRIRAHEQKAKELKDINADTLRSYRESVERVQDLTLDDWMRYHAHVTGVVSELEVNNGDLEDNNGKLEKKLTEIQRIVTSI